MTQKNITARRRAKPIICTFWQLAYAFAPLHIWHKKHLDSLHDVWKRGAPEPRSRLRNPKGYDPRIPQPGNYEGRIVFPGLLAKWIKDVADERGIPHNGGDEILRRLTRD